MRRRKNVVPATLTKFAAKKLAEKVIISAYTGEKTMEHDSRQWRGKSAPDVLFLTGYHGSPDEKALRDADSIFFDAAGIPQLDFYKRNIDVYKKDGLDGLYRLYRDAKRVMR